MSLPILPDAGYRYVNEVLRSGWWGYGPAARSLERYAEQWCGGGALATSSCTAALHLALLASGVRPRDEVIVPALTFSSTAAVVMHAGCIPRFADVDRESLTLSPDSVARQLSCRVKAVIPVHFAGVPVDMESLEAAVAPSGAVIIDDAAHAFGSQRDNWHVGSRSPFTCFSFAPTKSVPSPDGGLLVFRDKSLESLLRELSDMGLHVDTFGRSPRKLAAAKPNEIVRLGYHYRMNDLAAAIIIASIEELETIIAKRESLVAAYRSLLLSLPECELMAVPRNSRVSWYIYPIRVPQQLRDHLRDKLARSGIDSSVHYPCLHDQPAFVGCPGESQTARSESNRLITLPLHTDMTVSDVEQICFVVESVLRPRSRRRRAA